MTLSVRPTPNPNSLKFEVAGAELLPGGLVAAHSAAEAAAHPLGAALFALPGVHSVLILPAFATVTKDPGAAWDPIVEGVERVLTAHLAGA
jgi:hypothetical protein